MKTKILFVCSTNSKVLFNLIKDEGESNEYLSDSLFLECKSRENEFEVFECPPMLHMYEWSDTKKEDITGFGFGIRKKVKTECNALSIHETLKMIEDKFFDCIITDSRTMNPWWFQRGLSPFFESAQKIKNKFLSCYPKNKIILLDGEDQPNSILLDFYGNSLYFKRELNAEDANLFPISYSFPKCSFARKKFSEKNKILATIVPGIKSTYIFSDESKYYEDYFNSKFSLTWRKLGWDCFRHYEIIFNSSLPIFPGIENCPTRTMHNFPKNICKKILSLDCLKNSNFTKSNLAPGLDYYPGTLIEKSKINEQDYNELQEELVNHCLQYNTSEYMLNYVLEKSI
jgi:hypothetical protein